jgi:hypothetical protein
MDPVLFSGLLDLDTRSVVPVSLGLPCVAIASATPVAMRRDPVALRCRPMPSPAQPVRQRQARCGRAGTGGMPAPVDFSRRLRSRA